MGRPQMTAATNRTRTITPQISAGFIRIFGDDAPSLPPSRCFEIEFGGTTSLLSSLRLVEGYIKS